MGLLKVTFHRQMIQGSSEQPVPGLLKVTIEVREIFMMRPHPLLTANHRRKKEQKVLVSYEPSALVIFSVTAPAIQDWQERNFNIDPPRGFKMAMLQVGYKGPTAQTV
mmetsp:Transcript_34591/g.55807  ORF Transcript_34591/g.55807 Transcript_34591/m.55807 type:complete len:108 (+) Transcript_34591:499-822(+)